MTTVAGINERVKRYRLQEKCAAPTDDCIDLWTSMIRNPSCPWVLRLAAADRLMDRGRKRLRCGALWIGFMVP